MYDRIQTILLSVGFTRFAVERVGPDARVVLAPGVAQRERMALARVALRQFDIRQIGDSALLVSPVTIVAEAA